MLKKPVTNCLNHEATTKNSIAKILCHISGGIRDPEKKLKRRNKNLFVKEIDLKN